MNVATVQLPVGATVFVPGAATKVTVLGALKITIPEPPPPPMAPGGLPPAPPPPPPVFTVPAFPLSPLALPP